ncbi:type III secretion inner membrane ring lipoprotein SctJ [Chlamydiales bacterium]|nr:type III secretion inner membrane ring lipoprotein SctJ [Chlamydiales bacterium]
MLGIRKYHYLLLFVVLAMCSCSSNRTIVNGIEEREANEILVFLANKGIHASKTAAVESGAGAGRGAAMYDITVAETDGTQAMALLNIAGLPRRRGQNLLSIFGGGGLVPSQLEEKIRYQAGRGEQVASTIRKFDGVLDAEVQLSFPEEDPLNPEKTTDKVSASVYVKHSGILDDPNVNLTSKIRRLVASSIPGLSFDDVTVIGDRARFTNLLPDIGGKSSQDKLVSVWSVLVAQSSVGRFQAFFFTFLIVIIVLIIIMGWLIWRCNPLIKEAGGFKQLFKVTPMHVEEVEKEEEEEMEEEEEIEEEKKNEEVELEE